MPAYLTTAGETVTFADPDPVVADFLARAHAAAADPAVTVAQMVELIYGPENPTLARVEGIGRPVVTAEVFADPVFRVLSDLVGVKRVQAGHVEPAAVAERYTVTVADAATQLGITPTAVRAAINEKRLAGQQINGQWYTSEGAVASYRVSNRGRKSNKGVRVRGGWHAGAGLHVRCTGLRLAGMSSDPDMSMFLDGNLPDRWKTAFVKTSGSDNELRGFEIEPDPEAEKDEEIRVGNLYVTGPFKVVRRYNSTKAALKAEHDWINGARVAHLEAR